MFRGENDGEVTMTGTTETYPFPLFWDSRNWCRARSTSTGFLFFRQTDGVLGGKWRRVMVRPGGTEPECRVGGVGSGYCN